MYNSDTNYREMVKMYKEIYNQLWDMRSSLIDYCDKMDEFINKVLEEGERDLAIALKNELECAVTVVNMLMSKIFYKATYQK